jgi:hypothetical protein
MEREAEGSILGLNERSYAGDERRERSRRDSDSDRNGHGSIRVRTGVLLSLLAAAGGGGTVWVKTKEPDHDAALATRVTVLETQRALEKAYIERRLDSIETKVDLLVEAMPRRDREEVGRRR